MKVRKSIFVVPLILLSSFLAWADKIHTDPELDATIVNANELYLDSKFDKGIALIEGLEKSYPDHPAVSYFIANGYWWKLFRLYVYDKEARDDGLEDKFYNYLDQTVSRCQVMLKKNKYDPHALFYMGNAYSLKSRLKGLYGSYFSAGRDAARGKGYLEQLLKLEPKQYDAFYNLGVYNYLAGTLPGYAKVLKLFLFLPGGSKQKGLSLLKEAGEKSVYFATEAQLILARFYGDFEDQPYEALKIVESYHKKHPNNAWFHYWVGTLYSDEINDYERAEKIYEEVLEHCRQGVAGYSRELQNQAWLKLARVHSRQLYPEKAIEEIKALIASKPTQPSWIQTRAYLELGNTYDQIGMRKEAISAYNHVLTLKEFRNSHEQAKKLKTQNYNQTAADIYRLNLKGRRLVASGQYEEAQTSFQEVLQQYPNNEQTLYAIGELQFAKGAHQEAAEQFRNILRRNPKEPKWLVPGVYVRLGQIYQAIQQSEAARLSYQKALEAKFLASDDRNLAKRALKQMTQSTSS